MSDEHRWRRKCFVVCLLALFLGLIGMILPEITTGEAVYINATSINMTGFASYAGCTIANISDINHENCSAVETTSPWYITVNFTNITNFSYIELKNRYYSVAGASTHVNDVEIFCHTENAYVDLETFTNEKEWWYYSRNIADSMHFIDSVGNVSIRINHTENGNANHRELVDTLRLIQKPTFEQNNINLTQYVNNTTTGCSGDCDFNNLNVNTLGKNDTFNQFGGDIFLNSPFINTDGTNSSRLDLGDGSYSRLITENATYAGSITLNVDHAQIVAGNAESSTIDVFQSYIDLVANTTSYRFNKTYLDMNGANLTNCSNCATQSDLNTKVNKTGDTMTGDLNVSYHDVIARSFNASNSTLSFNNNIASGVISFIVSQASASSLQFSLSRTAINIVNLIGYSSTGTGSSVGIRFQLRSARGNITNPTGTKLGDYLGEITFVGYRNDASSFGDPAASIHVIAENDTYLSPQNVAAKMVFGTTKTGGTLPTDAVTIYSNQTIQLNNYTGTGNAYVCVDANGKLYRGSPGC